MIHRKNIFILLILTTYAQTTFSATHPSTTMLTKTELLQLMAALNRGEIDHQKASIHHYLFEPMKLNCIPSHIIDAKIEDYTITPGVFYNWLINSSPKTP